MADEQPEPKPIHFTQAVVLTVAEWPQYTTFTPEWLERRAHEQKGKVEGDVVTIKANNGTARYRLMRDAPRVHGAVLAELVEGDAPGRLRQRRAKYETPEEEV